MLSPEYFTYERLDLIADSYTPVLFFLAIYRTLLDISSGRKWFFTRGLGGLAVCYGIMAIDNSLPVWSQIDLDYSTHTAVAFTLAIYIVNGLPFKFYSSCVVASLVAYFGLMVYQQYHTWQDIISTAFVIGLFNFLIFWKWPENSVTNRAEPA